MLFSRGQLIDGQPRALLARVYFVEAGRDHLCVSGGFWVVASDKPCTVKKVGGTLYVIAFLVPPAALLWLRKPLQAAIASVCYGLAGFGADTLVIPGIILFFPIHLVWFEVFWFAPAAHAVATIKARHAGRPVAERADYVLALRRLTLTLFLLIAIPVIGRTLYWFYAAHQLRAEFDRWVGAPGHHMRWSQAAIEGFPFVARLRLTDASFGGTQPLPYDISAPLAILEAAPWIGADIRVTMPQGARLHLPALASGSKPLPSKSPPISAGAVPLSSMSGHSSYRE
ncbi:MAG: DUF2125 domain-containing protein [Acidobacteriia bacterium]|nr:DUF2125 domain-containing protein [Terriglobia bacterium]